MNNKDRLIKKIEERLDVPKKAVLGDENKNIEKTLGEFLIKNGFIKGVGKRKEDWGFVYHSETKKIDISEKEMPHIKWEKCIFKMGKNKETEENIFPSPGIETEKYRFLHEANHAYQEYLCCIESKEDPKNWHQKSLEGKIDSCYSKLFNFCFLKREAEDVLRGEKNEIERGLSIWGNASNYSFKEENEIPNRDSEIAVRAQEDANELATMFLWHPEYFQSYLDYLSLNYNNHEVREMELTKNDLEERGLIRITKEEADYLREVVSEYVKEMKKNIKL